MKLGFELPLPALLLPAPSLAFLFFPRVNLRTCLGEPLPVPASNRSEMTEYDRRRRREMRQLSEWAPSPCPLGAARASWGQLHILVYTTARTLPR